MDLVHIDEIRRRRPLDAEARKQVEELKRAMLDAVREDQARSDSARK